MNAVIADKGMGINVVINITSFINFEGQCQIADLDKWKRDLKNAGGPTELKQVF